jgi:hypothetical protein
MATSSLTPGPAAYVTLKKSNSCNLIGFGTSVRQSIISKSSASVGPGQYNDYDVSKLGKNKITLKSRHGSAFDDSKGKHVPGPG